MDKQLTKIILYLQRYLTWMLTYEIRPVVLYFFSYKTKFFPAKTIPINLDLSYKTDLDLWDCLGRVKLVL